MSLSLDNLDVGSIKPNGIYLLLKVLPVEERKPPKEIKSEGGIIIGTKESEPALFETVDPREKLVVAKVVAVGDGYKSDYGVEIKVNTEITVGSVVHVANPLINLFEVNGDKFFYLSQDRVLAVIGYEV